MKYGMNLLLWTGHVTSEHFPVLEKLKKAGYDGVEVPLFEGDAAHFKTVRKELDDQGLKATTVTVIPDEAHSPISADAKCRQGGLDHIKWALEMSGVLGAEVMAGPYHSPLAVFSGHGPTAEEKKRAAEVLRQAAEFAEQQKVKLTIEYLNRFECYFLTTAKDAAALVDAVNHPYFRTMYDSFHANIEEKSPAAAVAALGNRFAHVHISENDRGTPGTGMVRWPETFAALKKANYEGWMTIEAFGRALPALAAATKVWRDLFPSPEEVYTHGLKFMKESWAKA